MSQVLIADASLADLNGVFKLVEIAVKNESEDVHLAGIRLLHLSYSKF